MAGLPSTGPTPHQLITPRQTGSLQILAPTAAEEEDLTFGTIVQVSFASRVYSVLVRASFLISSPRNLSERITREELVLNAGKIPSLTRSS